MTGKTNVHEFSELSKEEQEIVISELKNYARHCMDEYARNFYRDKIKGGNDLVWYGRVETERHYKGDAEEVKMVLQNVAIRSQACSYIFTL